MVRQNKVLPCLPQKWYGNCHASRTGGAAHYIPFYYILQCITVTLLLLLLSCAKSHTLSASRRQLHLLHVSAVDRRQICRV